MTDFHDDLEARLRASLADRARQAPDGGALGEQILAAAESGVVPLRPVREHSRLRTWGMPLVAAAAVAAVVGGVVGVSHLRTDADHSSPLHHPSTAPATVTSTLPTASAVSGTPSASVSSQPTHGYGLTHFQVRDLTFVGENAGWALGTANCLSGSGTCTALAYSGDGTTWSGRGTTPFNVPGVKDCADPCVTNIRFASEQTGYAFGPAALFLTTDGAASWQRLAGGAAALETLNNNVIRVSPLPAGCVAPGCTYAVQTAAIGGTGWQASSLTDATTSGMTTGVQLSRSSGVAVLAVFGHPAGGASSATSAVYTSTDNGANWTNRGEPCTGVAIGGTQTENDTLSVTTAPDNSLSALCQQRSSSAGERVITSIDDGASWRPDGSANLTAATALAASSAHSFVVVDNIASVHYSSDAGASWRQGFQVAGFPTLVLIGFESASTGRVLQQGNIDPSTSAIWTTHNGGVTWSSTDLP